MYLDKNQKKALSKAIARAWLDDSFRKQLLENPVPALASLGLVVGIGVITFVPTEAQAIDDLVSRKDGNRLEVKLSGLPESLRDMTEEGIYSFLEDVIDWLTRLCST